MDIRTKPYGDNVTIIRPQNHNNSNISNNANDISKMIIAIGICIMVVYVVFSFIAQMTMYYEIWRY